MCTGLPPIDKNLNLARKTAECIPQKACEFERNMAR